jgi:hypothetical protein
MKKTYQAPRMKVATLDCEHLIASSLPNVKYDPDTSGGGMYTDRYKSPWSSENWANAED